jgi:hypothetical protein
MYDTAAAHVACSIGDVHKTLLVVQCGGLHVLGGEQSYQVLLAMVVVVLWVEVLGPST